MGQNWLVNDSKLLKEMMKKQTRFYLGIDVSKLWFDLSLLIVINYQKQGMITERFDNTQGGLAVMKKWLKERKVPFDENSFLVIENTGVYHRLLWQFFSKNNLPIHIGNAAQIKWSFGITRGKNDQIDSQRLCNYAYKNYEDLKATPALNPVFLQLKDLMSARTRLLSQLGSTRNYLKELKLSNDKAIQKIMEEAHKAAMEGMKRSIKIVEQQIKEIISKDGSIKNNYNLLITVPGIGHLTAVYILCCTNNFTIKVSGKQMACYAGVVPFNNRSGTSIKGRDKVHKMANKDLKRMLHLGALATLRYYPEFKDYYDRKKSEGKHSMSVLNAIRNKIILRAVAVVKNQQPYVNNYQKAA
jgi:transposase